MAPYARSTNAAFSPAWHPPATLVNQASKRHHQMRKEKEKNIRQVRQVRQVRQGNRSARRNPSLKRQFIPGNVTARGEHPVIRSGQGSRAPAPQTLNSPKPLAIRPLPKSGPWQRYAQSSTRKVPLFGQSGVLHAASARSSAALGLSAGRVHKAHESSGFLERGACLHESTSIQKEKLIGCPNESQIRLAQLRLDAAV